MKGLSPEALPRIALASDVALGRGKRSTWLKRSHVRGNARVCSTPSMRIAAIQQDSPYRCADRPARLRSHRPGCATRGSPGQMPCVARRAPSTPTVQPAPTEPGSDRVGYLSPSAGHHVSCRCVVRPSASAAAASPHLTPHWLGNCNTAARRTKIATVSPTAATNRATQKA
jgi:hypothetical protein